MIKKLEHNYPNIVAFEMVDEITQEQMDSVVMPEVNALIDKVDKINLVYLLNTDLEKFTAGAWFKDAMLGIKNLTKWHKSAIVTDSEGIQGFTEAFSKVMPGEFRGFDKEDLADAMKWASE